MAYDAQNRVTSKTYTGTTPTVTYTYGNSGCTPPFCRGKLLQVTSSAATWNATVFDALGRTVASN